MLNKVWKKNVGCCGDLDGRVDSSYFGGAIGCHLCNNLGIVDRMLGALPEARIDATWDRAHQFQGRLGWIERQDKR